MKPEFTWRVAREALPFFLGLIAIAAAAWAIGWLPVALGALFAALLVLSFFRDPQRRAAAEPGVVLAPADGRVVRVVPSEESAGPTISIFLSVLNVHINRIPVSGRVAAVERIPGRFRAAFRSEASDVNARVVVRIETPWGMVECVQITGLIARRIVCRLQPGDEVVAGERYGLIQFGSRVDIRLPRPAVPLVELGKRTRSGITPLARLGEAR
jgi:phosphatidylserine decarboxylase